MNRLLLAFLSLAASSPAFSALSTNNLDYYFDFNSQSFPGKCIYGSGNTPIISPSPISYNAGALTWHASGGTEDSGYIQTRQGNTATDESLKISSSAGIPPINCTNFAVSFNIRNYKGGAALFIINGATINSSWGIWGVGGGIPSWKDENGNPTNTPPHSTQAANGRVSSSPSRRKQQQSSSTGKIEEPMSSTALLPTLPA